MLLAATISLVQRSRTLRIPLNPATISSLAFLISALAALIIVASIAIPAVWSRDPNRRRCAKKALRLLTQFFSGK
jgi:hypothetical protein